MKAKSTMFAAIGVLLLAGTANAQVFVGGPLTGPVDPPGSGPWSPSPATILVSGLTNTIANITLTLTGVSHTFPDDLGAILVGPTGGKVILFDGPGTGTDWVGASFTFDDSAAAAMADGVFNPAGAYKPGQNQYSDVFTGAPAGPYSSSFAVAFGGTAGNGTWSLYVEDFVGGDTGTIGGWSISITQTPAPGALALLGLAGLVGSRRRRQA